MSEDFARATNAPREIELDGKTFRVSKLTPRDLGELQSYLKTACPDPRQEALKFMEGQPEAVAKIIWVQACQDAQDWPPSIDSKKGQELLATAEGIAHSLHTLLGKHQPAFSKEDAAALAEHIDLADLERLFGLVSPGETGDLKAAGADAP